MSEITVRVPESLRKRAEALAAGDGITLEQWLATALAEKIAVLEAGEYIAARAARGDAHAYAKVLDKVPDAAVAEDWDRLPDAKSSTP